MASCSHKNRIYVGRMIISVNHISVRRKSKSVALRKYEESCPRAFISTPNIRIEFPVQGLLSVLVRRILKYMLDAVLLADVTVKHRFFVGNF